MRIIGGPTIEADRDLAYAKGELLTAVDDLQPGVLSVTDRYEDLVLAERIGAAA